MTTRFQRFALALIIPILTVFVLISLAQLQNPPQTSVRDQETALRKFLHLSGVQIDSVGISPDAVGYFAVVDIIVGDDLEGSLLKVLRTAGAFLSTGSVQIDRFIIGCYRDSRTSITVAKVKASDALAFSFGDLTEDQLFRRIEFSPA